MMDALKRKQKFLRDFPNFSHIKNETRIDGRDGQLYRPFERFTDYKKRLKIDILFVYKERGRNIYNLLPGFHLLRQFDFHKRVKLLMGCVILIFSFFLIAEIMNIILGSFFTSLLILSLFVCFVYIPIQILVDMVKSLHIYHYCYDNSPEHMAEGCCFQETSEIFVFPSLYICLHRSSLLYYPILLYNEMVELIKSTKVGIFFSFITKQEKYVADSSEVMFLLGLVSTLDSTIQKATASQFEFLHCFVRRLDGSYGLLK